MSLVLASASPRRRELLRNAGVAFNVQPARLPEVQRPGEPPLDFALRLAREKARAVAVLRPRDYILGADTIVLVDDEVLGKPENPEDAMRMLRRLSGRSHQVSTAVALFGPGLDQAEIESTTVWFVELSEEDIRGYVASGEPMDKAGAYAIQGLAGRWIPRLEGCYFNVVGLPVPRLFRMLRSAHLL